MTVVDIMAAALDQQLQNRGIFSLGRKDCQAIMARVIEQAAAVAYEVSKRTTAERK
ncbi:hypothetical protein [uncultured Bradyrhizobium sp.]|uniref:hypothetical protein n=1 Tax=uncultured Bradyrhizobium sp. TaxID=199684 RepID=UPI0035CA2708